MHQNVQYLFQTFYHPYVSALVRQLNFGGIGGLLQRGLQLHPDAFQPNPPSQPNPKAFDFEQTYDPKDVIAEPYPVEDVDFEYDGAYAQYNWEIFFHVPLLIADRLSKNQRFEEAQRWFHYIFDPTDTSVEDTPQRYWQTRKFFEMEEKDYQKERIEHILYLLAKGADPEAKLTPEEQDELEGLEKGVLKWRKNPFKPHLIARMRTTAYQKNVVMKYLDNLVAWGDQLFRRDTIESINEATQLYILAAEILGERPQEVPPRATPQVQTFNSLVNLGAFSDPLVAIEEFIPPSAPGGDFVNPDPDAPMPAMLYFCIPANDKLLGYWDTVADRLFKIRHCMNIEGIVRQLPLFEPPIDPGMLVKAAAAGLDLGSVLNDLNAALPHHRFNVLVQRATELCGEVKALGGALLAALEKKDGEEMALLRAGHETALLNLVEEVRKRQLDEATQNEVALRKSRDIAVGRYLHYQKLLGAQSTQVPAEGQQIPEAPPSSHVSTQQEGGIQMITHETEELDYLESANESQGDASSYELAANFAHLIPNLKGAPFGVGVETGGQFVGFALGAYASLARASSADASYQASRAAKLGQYAMRAHDWALQSNLAAREIMYIDQQIVAAEIRKEIASRELENHRKQVENAEEVEAFMQDKYTNQELYGWMIGQISGVYFQAYQLAYDTAKRAERALRFELGLKDSSFVQFGYWDSLRRGLLAGEKAYFDLKRMEMSYLEQNRREYEIAKHVSLASLDPLALIELKQTGQCFVTLPEALFDLDFPGHFMRRIKSVSLTIPCVTGPYTGVNCTLTLLKHSIRHGNILLGPNYGRQEEDPRFTDSSGAIQSIVTSNAQNDSGLFETNLHDERYLPFEGAGAISEWCIDLPKDFKPFDYDTISDVVLHVRYTSREAGGMLKEKASLELQTAVNELAGGDGQPGPARFFSLRQEFAREWYRFLNPPADSVDDQTLTIPLTKERFPFLFQERAITVTTLELLVKVKTEFLTDYESNVKLSLETNAPVTDSLSVAAWNGLLRAEKGSVDWEVPAAPQVPEDAEWTLTAWLDTGGVEHERLDPKAIEDILLVCHFTV